MSLNIWFSEPFDEYAASTSATYPTAMQRNWAVVVNTVGTGRVGTNYGQYGGVGLFLSDHAALWQPLPSAQSIPGFVAGIAPFANSPSAVTILASWFDGAGVLLVYLRVNLDGSIEAVNGSGTSLGVSAAGVFPVGSPMHSIESQVTIHGAAGTVDVWLDATNVLALTAKDTNGASTATAASSVEFNSNVFQSFTGSTTGGMWIDDLVLYDGSSRTAGEKVGISAVQRPVLNGNGTGNVGTPTQVGGTGGSPWTVLTERPDDGDTSYLADGTPGDIMSFTTAGLRAGTTTIKAVMGHLVFREDDATPRTVATGVRTSSTNAFAAAVSTPGTYIGKQFPLPTDGTGAAWTPSAFNASDLLIKVVS